MSRTPSRSPRDRAYADDSAATAVQAMKLGALDYLTKPVEPNKLVTTVRNAIDHGRLAMRVSQLEREVEGRGYPGIVGNSPAMKSVFRQLDRLAVSDVTVLIHGESGTGKELVARAIHETSSRWRGSFVAVNSAAIPETLLESELFGHEKGAFTGAANRRVVRFEEAHRGTLCLDKVGELSATVQAKLLRVLQERSFLRVGGTATIQSDFRLITATHGDLAADVRTGRFREDPFFRLAVFELELPPLRERPEDIPALVQTFIRQNQQAAAARGVGISPDATGVLLRHNWPGNVRELQNVVQRAMVVAEGGHIEVRDLPARLLDSLRAWAARCPRYQRHPGGRLQAAAISRTREARRQCQRCQAGIERGEDTVLPDAGEVRPGGQNRGNQEDRTMKRAPAFSRMGPLPARIHFFLPIDRTSECAVPQRPSARSTRAV